MRPSAYDGKKVFVTGHTGFKGSWLALWLTRLGATVTGYSLSPPTTPNHWDLLDLGIKSIEADIRDAGSLRIAMENAAPDIVFHLAAQPLVRASYDMPLVTWDTNVMGTAHVLEACRHCPSVRAVVAVTTDKCYENNETGTPYAETDRLGGHDPYSASKAAMEILVDSYRKSFFSDDSALIATARAGNVIGGGDWSQDRLIPDLVRAVSNNKKLAVRNPQSTRPWQHVLDALHGYLLLGEKLLAGDKNFASAWNFGPDRNGNRTVRDILDTLGRYWPSADWMHDKPENAPHEANLLQLDSRKAHEMLNWHPVWDTDAALEKTAEWYRAYLEQGSVISIAQIETYQGNAG